MLLIRKAQIEALLKSQEDSFISHMKDHLLRNFQKEISKLGIKENALNHIIRNELNNAYKYDIIFENDMILYIECFAILGPDFDRNMKHQIVTEILNSKELDSSEKMDKIGEYITFELDHSYE